MRYVNAKFWKYILIVLGSVSWSLTMVKSGLVYPFGMGFWGPNGHDGVWHIALIKSLAQGSFENPVFAGEPLKNYHFFYDALLAFVHRVTTIPIHTLYFQIFPPLIAILVGWLTYQFVLAWRKSQLQAFFATFFVYFGGSWGWLVSFIRNGSFGGESMFWSQQAVSTLINPPYAASLALLMAGLILFLRYQKKPTAKLLILQALVFGVLIQVKAYAGIIALAGLGITVLWQSLRNRVTPLHQGVTLYTSLFFSTLIVSLLVFLPTNRGAGSLLVFSPFWFPETMVAFGDRFPWPRLASAIASYKSGGNLVKLIPAEILAAAIFFFGNLGSRIVKEPLVFSWLKNWRKLGNIEVFLLGMMAASVLPVFLFIQKGNPWNIIQFLYYGLFLFGITAGILVGEVFEKKKWGIWFAGVVILLTVPTTLSTLKDHYLPPRPPAKLSHEELEALSFLGKQPSGFVLTVPFDRQKAQAAEDNPPRPLYLYESTAYVAAFSGQRVFLEDEVNLEITGYRWRPRREETLGFFEEGDTGFLQENNISYLYLTGDQALPGKEEQLGLELIFENGEARVYRVL